MSYAQNKFLTIAMGECWHSLVWDEHNERYSYCDLCGFDLIRDAGDVSCVWDQAYNPDFSSYSGMGKLAEWVWIQPWKEKFYDWYERQVEGLFLPKVFADSLYQFLKETPKVKAWTDYPFTILGDTPHEIVPVREVEVFHYDGDKYCDLIVEGRVQSIKAGYVYAEPGWFGEVTKISSETLESLE